MKDSTLQAEHVINQHIRGWNPQSITTVDVLRREQVDQLARTLDLDVRRFSGAAAPLLWHWLAFQDWPASAALGADGHPATGHFYPPIPGRRRMFAGADVAAHGPLLIDEPITRRSRLHSTELKSGASGVLLFVTIEHQFEQGESLCRTEFQKIVYRSGAGGPHQKPQNDALELESSVPESWHVSHVVDALTLFRMSALTGNAHRIHYDLTYATEVEGYPGLLVHGPLLAILMADMAEQRWNTAPLREFGFRLRRPVFCGNPFLTEGTMTESGDTAQLVVTSGGGTAATATAVRA
jgi:3-methylfumaryl-CoA hydratase